MNRESLRANLSTLVAHALPKNARQLQCSVFDEQALRSTFGLRIDPQPAEGPVVALTDEAFVIKTGRTRFVVVDRTLATLCPAIGDKVRATPYIRRDFAGERLDAPKQECRQTSNGQTHFTTIVTLGGNTLRIPLPATPRCPYLADLVEQLEIMPTPDGQRTVANLLVDAKARDIEIVDPDDEHLIATPPEISFAVDTGKFSGRIAVLYDLYAVELRADGTTIKRIEEVDVTSLAEVMADLIDDGEWRRIRVEILGNNGGVKREVTQ